MIPPSRPYTAPPRIQVARSGCGGDTRPSPLTYWHLLSFDAPTVAGVWTIFVAWCSGIRLSFVDPLAMFLAVWMLYATDRLLDARPLRRQALPRELEERHRFHDGYRQQFRVGIACCALLVTALLPALLRSALELYAILGLSLAAWLLLVHAQPSPGRASRRLPKELAVGLFFPAAVFIPSVAGHPGFRVALLPQALLFAALCTLNCSSVYAWEHAHTEKTDGSVDRTGRLTTTLTAMAAGLGLLLELIENADFGGERIPIPHPAAIPAACALSATMLLLLHKRRETIAPVRLRALADLVLLTPVPVALVSVWVGAR